MQVMVIEILSVFSDRCSAYNMKNTKQGIRSSLWTPKAWMLVCRDSILCPIKLHHRQTPECTTDTYCYLKMKVFNKTFFI